MKHIWPLPQIDLMPFAEIEEPREAAVVTSRAAYDAVRSLLPLKIVWQAEPVEATLEHWEAIGAGLHGDVIYAIGGGLAADAAKYLSVIHHLPLICLPTALSVDAFLTWASGIRRDDCVTYIETRPPERLVVDFKVLEAAPAPLRAAGICDVLSIATGSWDWRFACDEGEDSSLPFIPYVYDAAQAILRGGLDYALAAGQGDASGLKQLLDCLALEVQLCNQIGHPRPEEGSEHYFAYAVENKMGRGLPHGDLVGPGIVLMAALQGQDIQPLKRALTDCHIPLNRIPADMMRSILLELPAYCRRHHLPFGKAHTLSELKAVEISKSIALLQTSGASGG